MSNASLNKSRSTSETGSPSISGSGKVSEQSDSYLINRVYLRGVDLVGLVERYLNNEFIDLKDPIPVYPAASIELVAQNEKIVTVSDNTKVKSYQLDLGAGQIFNCIGYKVYEADGRYGVIDPSVIAGSRCMFCLRRIGKSTDQAIGIPIRRQAIEGQIYYHMVDIFCRFRCAYAELRRRRGNQLYSHSMEYLAEIYTRTTGKDISQLKPSSDPRLLQIFNGPMTWDEYHADSTTFSEKPTNIFYVPIIEYVEQDPS